MGAKERLARYGLRCFCLACGQPGRHYPSDGRLRDKTCRYCRVPGFTVAWWWVCRFPTKAEVKRKQAEGVRHAIGC